MAALTSTSNSESSFSSDSSKGVNLLMESKCPESLIKDAKSYGILNGALFEYFDDNLETNKP